MICPIRKLVEKESYILKVMDLYRNVHNKKYTFIFYFISRVTAKLF